jgi:hypothetical protein
VREGLVYAQEHRLPFFEAVIAQVAAVLEGVQGDLRQALPLFETAIVSLNRAGDVASLAIALASSWPCASTGSTEPT